jgi:hypothetical protein
MFDPSADGNRAIRLAAQRGITSPSSSDCCKTRGASTSARDNFAVAANGHLDVVERLLQDVRVDPSAKNNEAVRMASQFGRLLQDERVDPSANNNYAIGFGAQNGHLDVVERLLQDVRVDPSADDNDAVAWAAGNGHLAVAERLLQDKRVDPSANNNYAVQLAAQNGHHAVVDRLLEDDRVDVAVAVQHSRAQDRKHFECRARLTEICIALQDLELPAWVTIKILRAARPWSTLPLHSKWSLVCTIKHFTISS